MKRGLTFLVLFWLLAGCAEAPQPPLRVVFNPWMGYDPLVLAGERRLFDPARRAGDLSRDDGRLIQVEAAQHGSAMASGRADAVITFEPMKSWLAARNFQVIFDSRAMPGEIVDVLVARADVLESRLPEWAALLAGWERARRALLADESAADRLAPGVELTPEEYRATLARLTLAGLKDNLRLLSGPSPELTRVEAGAAETRCQLGLIDRASDWGALLNARPVMQASATVEEGS